MQLTSKARRRFADTTNSLWEVTKITIMDLCQAYGEIYNIHPLEAKLQYDAGIITKYELFETFLRNEGIFGYTDKIISAFRICWEMD